jgi:hypothetical protein
VRGFGTPDPRILADTTFVAALDELALNFGTVALPGELRENCL